MRWEKLLRGLIARVGRFDFVDLELSEFTTTFFISHVESTFSMNWTWKMTFMLQQSRQLK